jgi:hypothetical protein
MSEDHNVVYITHIWNTILYQPAECKNISKLNLKCSHHNSGYYSLFYLLFRHDVSETGFCHRLQMEPDEVDRTGSGDRD